MRPITGVRGFAGGRRRRSVLLASCAMAAMLLGSCAAGPSYIAPAPSELGAPPAFTQVEGVALGKVAQDWWVEFGDPGLDAVVRQALEANLDVAQARSRLRQARAGLVEARAGLLPGLQGSVGASRNAQDSEFLSLGLDASYELDLFGGTRRGVEAARAGVQASEAQLEAIRLSIAAEAVLNYLAAREAEARLAIARDNLSALDETVDIVGWRRQAGLADELDLAQATQLRAQARAALPGLEADRRAALNRLSVLVGAAPGAGGVQLDPAGGLPAAPALLPGIAPADVIRRRPDVRQAERELAAQTARVGVATAAMMPALRLAGSLAGVGADLPGAADAMADAVSALLIQPLFAGGRLAAAREGQKAAAEAALMAYRQAVLVAFEDVENALSRLEASRSRLEAAQISEASARTAAQIARLRYRSGQIDFQGLLEVERTLLGASDALLSARTDRAGAAVGLYKALGGGWAATPSTGTAEGR